MAIDKNEHKEFYDKLATIYPEELLNMSSPGGIQLYNFICSELDKLNGSLIELGCGKGRFALYYAQSHPGDKVFGIDIAEANVKVARLRSKLMGLKNTSFIAKDISEPLPYKNFSNLICIETIEHLPEIDGLTSNIREIVKPNGTILITTPNEPHREDGYIESNTYLNAFGITEKYFHSGYTPEQLEEMFKIGFNIKEKYVWEEKKSVIILEKEAIT